MAGIGFELKRATYEDSYTGTIRSYLYAAVISSGPWLLSVFALSLLGVVSAGFLSQEVTTLFSATITHTFAASLITTGLIQMVVTRYLADQMYLDNEEAIAPTFVAVLVLSSGAQFVVMNLLLSTTNLPLEYRIPAVSLYVAVCGTWMAMVFLSAARDYVSIVLAFGIGYVGSVLAAVALGSYFGVGAYLMGFAAGQVLTLGLLMARVLAEFSVTESFNLEFFGHFRKYPALIAIGLTYNLGFWIDKLAFWSSSRGVEVNSFLKVFPQYDIMFFVASLVIVPALAIFTVNLETDFYNHYKDFYAVILEQRSLQELLAAKEGMFNSIRASYVTLLKLQIGLTLLLATVLTPSLMRIFGIPQAQWPTFRVMVIAMSFQVFLLFTMLVLLYFDLRGSVMIVCSTFLITNLGFTILTILGGFEFYGYGFLGASIVSAAVSLALLVNRFRNLEYLTFMRQPIQG
jgi:uncharacterized membrane protein